MRREVFFILLGTLGLCGCPSSWQAGPSVLADPRSVAAALGDPLPDTRSVLADLPRLEAPHHPRSCCAFGMDLEVDFAGMQVPFFEVGNVIDVEQLAVHAYDVPEGAPEPETNGLLYTCRGGWIDTAHARENADTFLYVALHAARDLESGTTIRIPGRGGETTIVVHPVPAALIEREGAMAIAAEIAAWVTWRVTLWHEITTWFGYQSVSGFSERPSTFSIEDLYSNALGIRLGRAVLDDRGFADRDGYDAVIAAFLREALERLEVLSLEESRAVMSTLDGRWWDSQQRLPNDLLVRRRAFPTGDREARPWRAEDAFGEGAVPEPLASRCGGAETRALALTSRVGRVPARELVSVSWVPEAWAREGFPFADPSRRVVDERELEHLTELVHDGLEEVLGAGFDAPRPSADQAR